MSAGISNSRAWILLSQCAKTSIDGNVKSSDVEEIMAAADENSDGIVTEDEFLTACSATYEDNLFKEYNDLKNELESFKLLSSTDDSLSSQDINDAINAFLNSDFKLVEPTFEPTSEPTSPSPDNIDYPEVPDIKPEQSNGNSSTRNTGGAGSTGGTGGTGGASGAAGQAQAPAAEQPEVEFTPTVEPAMITGEESVETLQAGRSETLTALNEARTQKTNLNSDPAMVAANEKVATTQQSYNDSLTALENKETALTETEQAVLDQKALKDENDSAMSDQQGVIDAANTAISDAQSALDACISAEPQQASYTKIETRTRTNDKGETESYEVEVPDTEAYQSAMADWTAEKNAAEAELANAELELAEAEAQMAELEAKEVEIDTQINEIIQQATEAGEEVSEELKNVQETLQTTYQAKQELAQVKMEKTAQIELDIAQLQANLSAYTNAISIAKANEQANNMQDVANDPDKLSEMMNDPEISEAHKLQLVSMANQVNPSAVEEALEDNPEFYEKTISSVAGEDGNTLEEVNAAALADLEAQMEQKLDELQTKEDSLTGLGKLWNGVTGLFGGGTKGAMDDLTNANGEIQQLYEAAKANPTQANLDALSKALNDEPVDWSATVQSVEAAKNLQEGTFTVNGQAVSQQDIVSMVMADVNSLEASFVDGCNSAGIITKMCSGLNNWLGTGTTKDMTQAQINELKENAQKLATTTDPQEFAALYKAVTGQSLTEGSVNQFVSGDSNPLENTAAGEAMMDYEQSTETIKTTAVGIAVGIATAATGGLVGAVLVGAAATVGIGALDAATQKNGQGVGANLLNYAKTDLVKDALVGGLNGLTGKLGNMASDKAIKFLAGKTVGKEVAEQIAQEAAEAAVEKAGKSLLSKAANKIGGEFLENMAAKAAQEAGEAAATNAMKNTLGFGARVLTEIADGALDGALANAGEYTIDAAAGENGNFTNAEGEFAAFENLKENFDFSEMLAQMGTGAVVGGLMSAGMQEGMRAAGAGFKYVTSKVSDLNAKFNSTGMDTVRTFSSLGEARSNAAVGDICKIDGSDHVGIKLSSGEIEELGISADTYKRLFPNGSNLKIEQGIIGDCYLLSSLYTMMKNPETSPAVLRCFTENADGSISVKLPKGNVEFTFDAGKVTTDYVFFTSVAGGNEGARMLEYVYGLELAHTKTQGVQDTLSRFIDDLSQLEDSRLKYQELLSLKGQDIDLDSVKQIIDEIPIWAYDGSKIGEFYPEFREQYYYSKFINTTENGFEINFDYIQSQISEVDKLSSDLPAKIKKLTKDLESLSNNKRLPQKLRNEGGFMDDVFDMFGLDSKGIYNTDMMQEILEDPSNWSKYIIGAGTKKINLFTELVTTVKDDIAGTHAYSIKPFKSEIDGSIQIEITNPWHTNKHTVISLDKFLKYFDQLYLATV